MLHGLSANCWNTWIALMQPLLGSLLPLWNETDNLLRTTAALFFHVYSFRHSNCFPFRQWRKNCAIIMVLLSKTFAWITHLFSSVREWIASLISSNVLYVAGTTRKKHLSSTICSTLLLSDQTFLRSFPVERLSGGRFIWPYTSLGSNWLHDLVDTSAKSPKFAKNSAFKS